MYLIDEYETSESFSVMLGAIARKTGNLEEVWPKGPKVHIDALYALSETNMHLRNVSVRSAVPYGEDQNSFFFTAAMIEMLQSLSKCKTLSELSLDSGKYDEEPITMRLPSVADACVRLRGRTTSVQLDGKECNPWTE